MPLPSVTPLDVMLIAMQQHYADGQLEESVRAAADIAQYLFPKPPQGDVRLELPDLRSWLAEVDKWSNGYTFHNLPDGDRKAVEFVGLVRQMVASHPNS